MAFRWLLFLSLFFSFSVFTTNIFDAIRSGDYYRVQELLDAGVQVDESGPQGYYPIVLAIELQDEQIVGLLLDRGADPDYLWTFANGNSKIIFLLELAREAKEGRQCLKEMLERRGQNIIEYLRDREIYGSFHKN